MDQRHHNSTSALISTLGVHEPCESVAVPGSLGLASLARSPNFIQQARMSPACGATRYAHISVGVTHYATKIAMLHGSVPVAGAPHHRPSACREAGNLLDLGCVRGRPCGATPRKRGPNPVKPQRTQSCPHRRAPFSLLITSRISVANCSSFLTPRSSNRWRCIDNSAHEHTQPIYRLYRLQRSR